MSAALDAALAYATAGYAVLPLYGKLPAIAKADGGNGIYDATTDPDQIREWWRQFPRANIGLAAGRFWALDIDPRHGGDATLAALEAEHGPLPKTPEQITGTNGRHLLFEPNGEAVRNRAGERHRLPPGLDTRSTGGYVVAAPSVHPDTGRRYRWREGRDLLRHPLAVAPSWLVELVAVRERPERFVTFVSAVPGAPTNAASASRAARYAAGALRRELEALSAAPVGGRNDALNTAAFNLAQLAPIGALDLGAAARDLAQVALARGLPPREVERTLASGIKAGLGRPREVEL